MMMLPVNCYPPLNSVAQNQRESMANQRFPMNYESKIDKSYYSDVPCLLEISKWSADHAQ